MPISYLLMLSLLAAAPEADVQTSDQQQAIHGTLTELGDAGIVVRVGTEDRRLPLESLLSVSLAANPGVNPEKATTFVELVDRSLLAATDYQVTGDTARILLVGGTRLEASTRSIRSVRFQAGEERDEKSNQQWSEIVAGKATADLLVVRKKGSLDYLEGVLQDLDGAGLKFQIDQEPITVKRAKIEGLVYYRTAGDPLPDALCAVSAIGGTRLEARTVRLTEGQWKITTPAGLTLTMPSEQVSQLDFTSTKVLYLSDLEPESAEYVPYFALKEELPALTDFFRPRRDVALEQGPLKLSGKIYRKGIAAHSRSLLSYRLPAEFNRFQALVGIDDNVRDSGNARLEIKGDGKSLWQGTLRGTEAAQNVDVAVTGVRRLEIVVDFGDDLDIADHVDLCDAKVTK